MSEVRFVEDVPVKAGVRTVVPTASEDGLLSEIGGR